MGWWDRLLRRRRTTTGARGDAYERLVQREKEAEVRLSELKAEATERVVKESEDAIAALEVVALATHRGRGAPLAVPRRKPEQSPIEQMAMRSLERQMNGNPVKEMMETLNGVVAMRDRMEDAADHLSGRRHRHDREGGESFMDMLASMADTELGKAVGATLGMRLVAGAVPAPSGPITTVAPVEPATATPPTLPAATPTAPAEPAVREPSGPIPLEVSLALQHMQRMTPADAAEWIFDHARRNPVLAQFVRQFVDAEPDQVPAVIEQAAASTAVGVWMPVIVHLRSNPWWTMALHARMNDLLADQEAAAAEAARG